MIEQIVQHTAEDDLHEIILINQDRTVASEKILSALHTKIRVVEYPRSEAHFHAMGHDHAAVLNQVMEEVTGDYVCLFDSDAHPVTSRWLETCDAILGEFDAIVADDPHRPGWSHPCFMLYPSKLVKLPLTFDLGLFSDTTDTGRLIGRQMAQAGARVYFAAGSRNFGGYWGHTFLNCVYHHDHGSFSGAGSRLRSQLNWEHSFFANIVRQRKRYSLTFIELIQYKIWLKLNALISSSGQKNI